MNIKEIDVDKMTDAIEKDAGQKIEGLKESIEEMKQYKSLETSNALEPVNNSNS